MWMVCVCGWAVRVDGMHRLRPGLFPIVCFVPFSVASVERKHHPPANTVIARNRKRLASSACEWLSLGKNGCYLCGDSCASVLGCEKSLAYQPGDAFLKHLCRCHVVESETQVHVAV